MEIANFPSVVTRPYHVVSIRGMAAVLNVHRQLAMSQATPAQYLISLCTAAQQSDEPFDVAVRIGSFNSKFEAATSKVIHSILTFSPAPNTMAVEFLNELRKVAGMASLGKCSLCIPAGIC